MDKSVGLAAYEFWSCWSPCDSSCFRKNKRKRHLRQRKSGSSSKGSMHVESRFICVCVCVCFTVCLNFYSHYHFPAKWQPSLQQPLFSLWVVGFMSRMQNLSAENAKFKMADDSSRIQKDRTGEFSNVENQQETDDEKLERQYFWKVVEAFLYYK